MKINIILFTFISALFFQCNSDDIGLDQGQNPDVQKEISPLSQHVIDNFIPLGTEPIGWTNNELDFLDEWKDLKILGLGEATHGTKDFFQSKDRIMRYMVENHDFKIFGIEADFGESIYINEAVLASDKDAIRSLMHDKMHFWTWETEEVFDMLIWMCEYNEGKSEKDKVQYVGVDCQNNTYHPLQLNNYFKVYSELLQNETAAMLSFLMNGATNGYQNLDYESYLEKVEEIDEHILLLKSQRDILIEASSFSQYLLAERLYELCKQSFESEWSYDHPGEIPHNRDTYMAENSLWYINEYFENEKMVMWQHNYHVAKIITYGPEGSMGNVLSRALGDDYKVIAFSFGKGSFNAIQQSGNIYLGLRPLSITTDPLGNSLNSYFYRAEEPVFAIKTSDLMKDNEWTNSLIGGIDMLNIGSTYKGSPGIYYNQIKGSYWDLFIHFQETSHAEVLE